jgi:hypothetical protein
MRHRCATLLSYRLLSCRPHVRREVLTRAAGSHFRSLRMPDPGLGNAPSDADLAELHKEAERRRVAKIPPGYLDEKKEGDRKYGDYVLWSQTLDYAKQRAKPVILVTSERKEDWWESYSGKRVGPRPELLREAVARSGQRVLVFQTERFLEVSAERNGLTVAQEVVAEIQDVGRRHELPAVSVVQRPTSATQEKQEGEIAICVLRPVRNATGSGRLQPRMVAPPRVWATLLSAPEEAPRLYIGSNTGTTFDFNIHFQSTHHGDLLPPGEYLFRYTTECISETVHRGLPWHVVENSGAVSAGEKTASSHVESATHKAVAADDPAAGKS